MVCLLVKGMGNAIQGNARGTVSYVRTDIPQVTYVFHINMQTPKTHCQQYVV